MIHIQLTFYIISHLKHYFKEMHDFIKIKFMFLTI